MEKINCTYTPSHEIEHSGYVDVSVPAMKLRFEVFVIFSHVAWSRTIAADADENEEDRLRTVLACLMDAALQSVGKQYFCFSVCLPNGEGSMVPVPLKAASQGVQGGRLICVVLDED